MVFTRQFTPAVVYAWVKLREQVRFSWNILLLFTWNNLTILLGNSKHHLDCGMYRTASERADRKLHSGVLVYHISHFLFFGPSLSHAILYCIVYTLSRFDKPLQICVLLLSAIGVQWRNSFTSNASRLWLNSFLRTETNSSDYLNSCCNMIMFNEIPRISFFHLLF
jgi:hypothetical protein